MDDGTERGESAPEPLHRRRQTPSSRRPPESNAPPDDALESRHGCTSVARCRSAPLQPVPPGAHSSRLLGTFTIEGRAAPGLFVVGWLRDHCWASASSSSVALAPSGLLVYFLGPLVLATGLIAGAGNQAIERRRAQGEGLRRPVAVPRLRGDDRGDLRDRVSRRAGPPRGARRCGTPSTWSGCWASAPGVVFVGVVRLTVVGTNALSWQEMGWRRPDGSTLPTSRRRAVRGAR